MDSHLMTQSNGHGSFMSALQRQYPTAGYPAFTKWKLVCVSVDGDMNL